jgi:formate/nitrite transporter FocA (FNT family)
MFEGEAAKAEASINVNKCRAAVGGFVAGGVAVLKHTRSADKCRHILATLCSTVCFSLGLILILSTTMEHRRLVRSTGGFGFLPPPLQASLQRQAAYQ